MVNITYVNFTSIKRRRKSRRTGLSKPAHPKKQKDMQDTENPQRAVLIQLNTTSFLLLDLLPPTLVHRFAKTKETAGTARVPRTASPEREVPS